MSANEEQEEPQPLMNNNTTHHGSSLDHQQLAPIQPNSPSQAISSSVSSAEIMVTDHDIGSSREGAVVGTSSSASPSTLTILPQQLQHSEQLARNTTVNTLDSSQHPMLTISTSSTDSQHHSHSDSNQKNISSISFLAKHFKSFSNNDIIHFLKKLPHHGHSDSDRSQNTSLQSAQVKTGKEHSPKSPKIPKANPTSPDVTLDSNNNYDESHTLKKNVISDGHLSISSSLLQQTSNTSQSTPEKDHRSKTSTSTSSTTKTPTSNIYSSSSEDEGGGNRESKIRRRRSSSSRMTSPNLSQTVEVKIKKIGLKTLYNMMVLQPSITDKVLPLLLIDVRSSEKDFIISPLSQTSPSHPKASSSHGLTISEMNNILSSQIENEISRPRHVSCSSEQLHNNYVNISVPSPPSDEHSNAGYLPTTSTTTRPRTLSNSSAVPVLNLHSMSHSSHSGSQESLASPKTFHQLSPRSSSLGLSQHIQWSIHFYLPDYIIEHIPVDELNKDNVLSIIHMIETTNTCIEKELYRTRFAWRKMSNVVVIGGSARDEARVKWLLRVLQLEGKSYNLYTLHYPLNYGHFEAKYPFSITSFDFVEFLLPSHIYKNIYLSGYRVLSQERAIDVLLSKRINIRNVLNCAKECKCVIPDKLICNTNDPLEKTPQKFSYLHIRLDDHDPVFCYFTAEQMKESVMFINRAAKNNENILIHCQEGRSRSVTLITLFLMICVGWRVYNTLDFIKTHRPNMSVHATYVKQLRAIEEYLLDKIEKIKYDNSNNSDESIFDIEGIVKVESGQHISESDGEQSTTTAPGTLLKSQNSMASMLEYSSTDDSTNPNHSNLSSPGGNRKSSRKFSEKMNVALLFTRMGLKSTLSSSSPTPQQDSPNTVIESPEFCSDEDILEQLLDEIGENVVNPFIKELLETSSTCCVTTTTTTSPSTNSSQHQ
ncbi:hypothetical protein C9374_005360 [Naegleria lovaniensis]|uniref:protein-tyrosine-phosphatase n=1 Tax=Naegleria lovaniensis TaxID=51637 RepID=A0AA88KJS3_NAELO|nr:uncharacterized protein C9374_005360 [Naegleria lovaniensis]KAG2382158.1 hypothetical protein C9374_005360 [Naegleria lovaniensis]